MVTNIEKHVELDKTVTVEYGVAQSENLNQVSAENEEPRGEAQQREVYVRVCTNNIMKKCQHGKSVSRGDL